MTSPRATDLRESDPSPLPPELTSPLLPDLTSPRVQVLLAVADDALVAGHRASHWTGVAPTLEEDLAFATIAQDGISHADLWYALLVGDDHPNRRAAVDALGLGRPADGYRHAIVCERPPIDFAHTLARHWLLTLATAVRLAVLSASSDPEVAALAVKLAFDQRYHLEHAAHWFDRLARAGEDAHRRFGVALAAVLAEAPGLVEAVAGEQPAVTDGLLPGGHPGLWPTLLERLEAPLAAGGYAALVPAEGVASAADSRAGLGGRLGHHSPDFTDDVWPEMTALYRAHPGARW
jgi:ring-1,2-phenylacetyl-CoA epoxidase subunit PaaC